MVIIACIYNDVITMDDVIIMNRMKFKVIDYSMESYVPLVVTDPELLDDVLCAGSPGLEVTNTPVCSTPYIFYVS